MGQDDSDKTEEPTEHKLQESRKKGQVFKSQDIISTILLACTAGVLYAERVFIVKKMGGLMRYFFNQITSDINLTERNMFMDFVHILITFFTVLAPILAIGFIMAIVANMAQIKFIFTFETMKPKLSKLNPIEGFKRIFSMKSLMELFKQLLKLGVVTWVCVKVIKGQIMSLKMASFWEVEQTIGMVRKMGVRIFSYVLGAMAVISVLDYVFQKKQYMKQMKMSIKELKDEYKDTEGNPQVKGKIKQLMRQNAQQRMMEEVPGSSAVVANPTHLAVAVRYNPGQDKAPVIVAKGKGIIAQHIKIIAENSDVPIIENVELARAIYSAVEIGATIPVDLYKATAEVLAYVFRLKKKRELMKKKRFMKGRSGIAAG